MLFPAILATIAAATPLDAFHANFASTRVDIDFRYEAGRADRGVISGPAIWKGDVGIVVDRKRTIVGRWEYDGHAQHFVTSPLPDVELAGRAERETATIVQTPPAVEGIFDGEVAAWHTENISGSSLLEMMVTKRCPYFQLGPYSWIFATHFPVCLEDVLPGIEPTYRQVVRDGQPYEVATYLRSQPKIWVRADFRYDPSIGYLPRFIRLVDYSEGAGGAALVSEMYLVEARACAAGGFVPTEWYEVKYRVSSFKSILPTYDDATILAPQKDQVPIKHFRVTGFRDKVGPARLERLKGIRRIAGVGGIAEFARLPDSLTLGQAREMLGRKKLTEPILAVTPTLDTRELHQFDQPAPRPWLSYGAVAAGLVLLTVVLLLVRRRNRG